ncbi:MAG: hypothetical protein QM270_09670 [Bacillota bacterium]|nr:hypothetical protein [Bacillota bacterium]
MPQRMEWQTEVHFWRDPLLLLYSLILLVLPLALIGLILALALFRLWPFLLCLGLGIALALLLQLLIHLGYGSRYQLHCRVDERGILCRSQLMPRRSKVTRFCAKLARPFASRPTVAGPGLFARPRQEVFLRWPSIHSFRRPGPSRAILIRSGALQWLQLVGSHSEIADAHVIINTNAKSLDSMQLD